MGKKKENENLAEELEKSFERWEHLKEHGGSDPFYVLFGKLSAPTFFTLNAPVFQMVWINIQNFCICLRSLFKVSIV